jgi:glutamate-5-semialdehyde dehydrogenase
MTQHNQSWKEASLKASRSLNLLSDEQINKVLLAIANEALVKIDFIIAENQKDLASMEKNNPMYDRLY